MEFNKEASLLTAGAKALGTFAAKNTGKRMMIGAATGAGVKGAGYMLNGNNQNKTLGGLAGSMLSGATTGAAVGSLASTQNLTGAGKSLSNLGTKVFDNSKTGIGMNTGLGINSVGNALTNSVKLANSRDIELEKLASNILEEAGFIVK